MSDKPHHEQSGREEEQGAPENGQVHSTGPHKFPIVGIGASAGGLDALQKFFAAMPVDTGIGFVVVTHIQPERESMLPEILSNVTDIPVVEAEDGIGLAPNQIVIAKDKLLLLTDGARSASRPSTAPVVWSWSRTPTRPSTRACLTVP